MSQLRQQATVLKTAGAATRRNWNPSPDSSHFKVYRWWLRKSGKQVPVENFCHYWRVVVLWAPLRLLAKPLLVLAALVVVAAIVMLTVAQTSITLGVILALVGVVYLVFSIVVVTQLFYVAALPLELIVAVSMLVFGPIVIALKSLHTDHKLYGRVVNWSVDTHFSDRVALTWIRPWLAVPAALAVLSVWYEVPRVILLSAGGLAVLCGVVVGLAYLSDRATERRKAAERVMKAQQQERKKVATKVVLQQLFVVLHPEWVNDNSRFQAWLERYEGWCVSYWDDTAYDLPFHYHLWFTSKRYEKRYGQGAAEAAAEKIAQPRVVKRKKPCKLRRTMRGVGDFFVLIWSFVLTRKWKICPIVQLPE